MANRCIQTRLCPGRHLASRPLSYSTSQAFPKRPFMGFSLAGAPRSETRIRERDCSSRQGSTSHGCPEMYKQPPRLRRLGNAAPPVLNPTVAGATPTRRDVRDTTFVR